MSKKLEQVLECLINEESDRASELLHDVIVEKARGLYQELVNEEDDMELEEEVVEEEEAVEEGEDCDSDDEEELKEFAGDEEDFGGDMADDFDSEIEADMTDDEGEFDAEESDEEEVEDRVEDLEAALADLRAEFDALMDEELEEPHHDAEDFEVDADDMDMEDDMDESMMEATKLQDKVAEPSNVEGADNKEAPYTKAPSKRLDGADPVDFAGDAEEQGMKAEKGSDHTPSDNIDEEPSATPAAKQSDKADEKHSLFTKEPK
jgi:hypothetical protein